MENYTFNFEVRRSILHFMSALDGGVVKRYDKDQNVKDTIAVNYLYGPKERILHDIIDESEHIKLPVVSVMMTSLERDNNRVKEKIDGRIEHRKSYNKEEILKIPSPIPININFDVTIISKYQMDLDQILSNFIPYSDPYFIVQIQEPFTEEALNCKVLWNGNVTLDNPKDLSNTDPYRHLMANTSFTFEGYMFKEKAQPQGRICKIDTDFILTNKFFCNYDDLLTHTASAPTESFSISGVPRIDWADPMAIKTGSTMFGCSGNNPNFEKYFDPTEIVGNTEHLTIQGWFPNITDVFLSASNPDMFVNHTPSAIDIFDGSETYPEFTGIVVDKRVQEAGDYTTITFDVPSLRGNGYLDVIVVNPCGYSKLTNDRRYMTDCCENPYNVSHPLYDDWENLRDPFSSGIEVIQTNLECVSGVTLLGTVDGKVIKTLGDFFMIEL